MNPVQFFLQEKYAIHSPDPNCIDQPLSATLPDLVVSDKKIPKILIEFTSHETWIITHAVAILNNNSQAITGDLYIEELLSKSHEPNTLFENVRQNLMAGRYFAFRLVTAENIKIRLQQKIPSSIFFVYYVFHFLFRRVLPKLNGFRAVCRWLKIPADMSKAEIMGRLIYKGFNIVDLIETDYETLIISQVNPETNPSESKPLPNEGVLFRMQRVGQNEKPITVYKFRSMHPYAEYVQEYLHKTNGIDVGGKFKNDFRVSTGGRLIRKYWIDELPMLVNLLRGDLKLVGVRPISEHYFGLYPASARQIRRNHKPGLLPPFYADLPGTFDEIVQSEIDYLTQYEERPVLTDMIYFARILQNIVIYKARSK